MILIIDNQQQVNRASSCCHTKQPLKYVALFGVVKCFWKRYWLRIWISWLQVIFGNTLHYWVNMSNWFWPEHGILYILIIDIILRSALAVFRLLCAINYHDNKKPVCNVFLVYSHYRYGELSILFLFTYPC